MSWYVNTNEDVADFRVELTSLTRESGPRTLLVKDISYNSRYDVIDHVPGGEELRMCLLTKTSLGSVVIICTTCLIDELSVQCHENTKPSS